MPAKESNPRRAPGAANPTSRKSSPRFKSRWRRRERPSIGRLRRPRVYGNLEDAVARQQAQIEALEKQLADAKQQVQDIAVKAIEGASGARALSHINQIAMEQAKNRPQG